MKKNNKLFITKHLEYKKLARSLNGSDFETENCQDGKLLKVCFVMQKILTYPFGDVSFIIKVQSLQFYCL